MLLSERVYALCRSWPNEERYRLSDQLIRAATSIPANIAEGFARGSAKDYARFLAIARGSNAECETFIELAFRINYVDEATFAELNELATGIGKMLTVLRERVAASAVK
jgi:four helix bundle protein